MHKFYVWKNFFLFNYNQDLRHQVLCEKREKNNGIWEPSKGEKNQKLLSERNLSLSFSCQETSASEIRLN